ncbi:hypothetical protein [Anaerorhabdus sp.]|uniref:Uncharacterized protein n=1 Tax=bioreactor metagenome TaxID=1076179 RepID=A0A645HF50_9ZZZZ|nr:hypothetical protein [Anaerorhabdus sp.]MEA4874020.1 hypothetical protein [Anaerorhabdus sp.]
MFNLVWKVRPEIKEDQQFQQGLKIIKNIQIALFGLMIVFYGIFILVAGAPIDFKLLYSVFLRFATISIIGVGIKSIMILFLVLSSFGLLTSSFLFITFFNQLTPLGVVVSGLEVLLILASVSAIVFVFTQTDTKYVIAVTKDAYKETQKREKPQENNIDGTNHDN